MVAIVNKMTLNLPIEKSTTKLLMISQMHTRNQILCLHSEHDILYLSQLKCLAAMTILPNWLNLLDQPS